MTKPLRTTGIVFLTMLLVLLSLMIPVHAEDQKAAEAGTTGTDKRSIYDNDYNMGSLTVKDFRNGEFFTIKVPDDSAIIDKSIVVNKMSENGQKVYILKLPTAEEAYKAYGYYRSKGFDITRGYIPPAITTLVQDITFDGNGGTGSMAVQKIRTKYSYEDPLPEKVALLKNEFTRKGYRFTGWNTKADGTGITFSDGEKVSMLWDDVKQEDEKNFHLRPHEITVYAQWTPDKYTVRYHANGGTGQMVNQEMAYGTEEALIAKGFTRDGYEFTGWNTKADGSGRMYKDKENVKNLSSENNGKVELYAQWEKNNSKAVSDSASGFTGPKTGDNNGIGRDILILAAACTLAIVLRVKRAKGISE